MFKHPDHHLFGSTCHEHYEIEIIKDAKKENSRIQAIHSYFLTPWHLNRPYSPIAVPWFRCFHYNYANFCCNS